MAEDRVAFPIDGAEFAIEDVETMADECALADDRVFAEFLRLVPFTGTNLAKVILPYGPSPGEFGGSVASLAFIQPNGATGTVRVMPFRAVVGTRTLLSSVSAAKNNWRDIRSAVYAVSDDGSTLGHAAAITANASGSTRIDTVYAQMTVDASTAAASRIVKPVGSGTAAPASPNTRVAQSIAIVVAAGTHTAPATLPADNTTTGVFCIPLAYVFVPNGFTAGSTVAPDAIQEIAPTAAQGANRSLGFVGAGPMECVSTNPPAGQLATYAASGRPAWMMPSTMQGAMVRFFGVQTGSIVDGAVIDASMDWRYRLSIVRALGQNSGGSPSTFAFNGGSVLAYIPIAGGATNLDAAVQDGQSFQADDHDVIPSLTPTRHGATLGYFTAADLPNTLSGAQKIGLYVDMNTGQLRIYLPSSFSGVVFFWVFVTGQMSNPG
jgi:hypothetical protein